MWVNNSPQPLRHRRSPKRPIVAELWVDPATFPKWDDGYKRVLASLDKAEGPIRAQGGDFWAPVCAPDVDAMDIPPSRQVADLRLKEGAQPLYVRSFPTPVNRQAAEQEVLR